jgi:hypothetical protein
VLWYYRSQLASLQFHSYLALKGHDEDTQDCIVGQQLVKYAEDIVEIWLVEMIETSTNVIHAKD